MIHVGRHAIDRAGVAELHGLTWRQARRARPWARDGHPEPISRGRTQLWDQEQAEAFARGEPVPELPVGNVHARDLLDRWEAAEWAGADPVAWERDMYRGRTPEPDEEVYGVPHWYRATVDAHREGRAVPQRGGGRPPGRAESLPRGEIRDRVHALLREAIDTGTPISTAEIARRLGIHYATAHKHVTAIRREAAEQA
ncbi:hypothetical protein [Prauserella flavalba]|uniref:hypothetical protein n=1 Tax=Prauserella flavalba TaxID=1477506 RepID=UPI0036DFA9FA